MIRTCLILLLSAVVLVAGCATTPPANPAKYQISDFEAQGTERPLAVSDPIVSINKGLYRFNYNFDRFVFLPVVNTYEFILPNYVEKRVSNFMDNIGEFGNFTNAVLQLKPKSAGITLSRFVINSTVGIAGLWDPASHWKLQRQDEDFGQTLGRYGTGNGPYIVLPILGPSNLRDTVGLVGDTMAFNAVDPLNFDHNESWELPYQGVRAVDARHRQPFRYYKSGSPFEYELVRLLYTEKRKLQIAK
jgi:phospholipid-binding lipoprotein MlaA